MLHASPDEDDLFWAVQLSGDASTSRTSLTSGAARAEFEVGLLLPTGAYLVVCRHVFFLHSVEGSSISLYIAKRNILHLPNAPDSERY